MLKAGCRCSRWLRWRRTSAGATAPTEEFHAAVRAAKVGEEEDIPHLSAALINKYANDLRRLGLL
jgi:fatty acid CoA ligase FadD9